MHSETFHINDGLQQGPTLFITIMDDIIKSLNNKTKKVNISFHNLRIISLRE